MAPTPNTAATISMIKKRTGLSRVNRNTQDSGNTVTMWNSAKLASGANAPSMMFWPSRATVSEMRAGCNSRVSNSVAYSSVVTMRSRANSATTLMAKATKNG